jgi:cytochrome d ubiquinol oxidase subunit I
MAYEVLSAFFLEAGFLGVMLFGREYVGNKLHMFATAIVAFGKLMSATWILSVNSWMQTPAGYSINELGQFYPEDWWAIVFKPSFPYRLVHMVLAAYLTVALVVGGVGCLHLLRNRKDGPARRMFSMAMWMLIVVTPLQILAGDFHGINTLEHQPAKVMAMEGHYDSHPDGAPLILFGIPNPEEKRIDYAIQIPQVSSLILKHEWGAPLDGLDTIPDANEPPVAILFWSFRIMVGLGFAMLGLSAWSLLRRMRGGVPLMQSPLLKKIGWFVALWIMSVLALGIVAYAIRLAIIPYSPANSKAGVYHSLESRSASSNFATEPI